MSEKRPLDLSQNKLSTNDGTDVTGNPLGGDFPVNILTGSYNVTDATLIFSIPAQYRRLLLDGMRIMTNDLVKEAIPVTTQELLAEHFPDLLQILDDLKELRSEDGRSITNALACIAKRDLLPADLLDLPDHRERTEVKERRIDRLFWKVRNVWIFKDYADKLSTDAQAYVDLKYGKDVLDQIDDFFSFEEDGGEIIEVVERYLSTRLAVGLQQIVDTYFVQAANRAKREVDSAATEGQGSFLNGIIVLEKMVRSYCLELCDISDLEEAQDEYIQAKAALGQQLHASAKKDKWMGIEYPDIILAPAKERYEQWFSTEINRKYIEAFYEHENPVDAATQSWVITASVIKDRILDFAMLYGVQANEQLLEDRLDLLNGRIKEQPVTNFKEYMELRTDDAVTEIEQEYVTVLTKIKEKQNKKIGHLFGDKVDISQLSKENIEEISNYFIISSMLAYFKSDLEYSRKGSIHLSKRTEMEIFNDWEIMQDHFLKNGERRDLGNEPPEPLLMSNYFMEDNLEEELQEGYNTWLRSIMK